MSHTSGGTDGGLQEKFRKENSILIEVGDNRKVKIQSVISAAAKACGSDNILGCVPRSGNCYEMTVKDRKALDVLEDGLMIGAEFYSARKTVPDTFVTSVMHLPTYVSDCEIKTRFFAMGVDVVSPIKRRYIELDDVRYADGTRFFKTKLPSKRKSLPFTMKFSDGNLESYYRVIHNGQCKVCAVCGSNDHLRKDCPDFECFQCGKQGHMKRFCTAEKCQNCYSYKCMCSDIEEDVEEERGSDVEKSETLCELCGLMSCNCESETDKNDEGNGKEQENGTENDENVRNEDDKNEEDTEKDEINEDKDDHGVEVDGDNNGNDDEYDERDFNDEDAEIKDIDNTNIDTNQQDKESVFGDFFDLGKKQEVLVEAPATHSTSELETMEIDNTRQRKRTGSRVRGDNRSKVRVTECEQANDKNNV